jgi:hypothetical protein
LAEARTAWISAARRAVFGRYRDEGAREWISASGESMRPLIRPGAFLLVEFGARPRGPGEIVLFPLRDRIVSHRLVGSRPRGGRTLLLTKGDAQPFFDPLVDPEDVLGVVRALRPEVDGPATSIGCAGRHARAIARASLFGGRAAPRLRRAALRLPGSLRGAALRAVPPLAETVTRAVAATAAIRAANVSERR